ncbi:MAG TPA: M20/M25/M40 family metallo-hydrolase [Gemmatimonadales bacterium]|nr:M20/M25/M40 family metallo-hydrolase [Gemmatimonadales bacterium]
MKPHKMITAAALVAAFPALLAAQQGTVPATREAPAVAGYTPAAAERQAQVERAAIAIPDSASARRHARELTREAHVAGTPAQERTRDYVLQVMREAGLEVEARPYEIYLPHATEVRAWVLGGESGDSVELNLVEPPIAADADTRLPQYPAVNGYSGAGDVSGELVYVNYGLIEDYARLDSLGVSVRGRIAVARYGRSFRGIKAREAERNGAIGLIIYSDPIEDGFVRGDVYPEGPMRPAEAVQRGSVMNVIGDPSTPGWGSVPGARRLPVDSLDIPRIPVLPMSYANAAQLLKGLRGTDIPAGWQGGLPFRYHIGPGPVRARVVVRDDRNETPYKTIWNTLGTIRGTDFPDEVIVIGAHRDAWGPGASDNVSGTVSVLEAARAVGALVEQGMRPRRTLVFGTWDAEEWGIIGSTEYAEQEAENLTRNGVAYLNQDGAASGPSFGGGGSPSLRSTLRSVASVVPDPGGDGSVYAAWRKRTGAAEGTEPAMGDPGGGSDFAGFYNHLGVPHADWGFGGPYGVYHSHYDTYNWMATFGDTAFTSHAAAGRMGAAMLMRLANADVVPYDYVEYAETMRRNAEPLDRALKERSLGDASALLQAVDGMRAAAVKFASARDARLKSGNPSAAVLERTNAALRTVERQLTRPEGLRTRPWYRNLVYAADENNGYATIGFPSVAEAMRSGNAALVRAEVADLAERFNRATAAVEEATRAIGG